jgi:hypothetical protein
LVARLFLKTQFQFFCCRSNQQSSLFCPKSNLVMQLCLSFIFITSVFSFHFDRFFGTGSKQISEPSVIFIGHNLSGRFYDILLPNWIIMPIDFVPSQEHSRELWHQVHHYLDGQKSGHKTGHKHQSCSSDEFNDVPVK